MAMARLLVLIFLVPIMGAIGSGTNTAAAVATFVFFIAVPVLYFLPSIEAKINQNPNMTPILVVNLFLGWTLVGWVVALAWAHKKAQGQNSESLNPVAPTQGKADQDEKTCPYCAELVKKAAVKCRHCGSSLT